MDRVQLAEGDRTIGYTERHSVCLEANGKNGNVVLVRHDFQMYAEPCREGINERGRREQEETTAVYTYELYIYIFCTYIVICAAGVYFSEVAVQAKIK